MQAAKSKVEKGFTASLPGRFTRFFKTPSFDKLARACLQHYLSVAEQQALSMVQHLICSQYILQCPGHMITLGTMLLYRPLNCCLCITRKDEKERLQEYEPS